MSKLPLIINNLGFRYPGQSTRLLSGLDLRVNRGECVAIQGANGSGKSTLVSLISGVAQSFGEGEISGEIRRAPDGQTPLVVLQDPDSQLLCERVENELAFFRTHTDRGSEGLGVEEAISSAGLEEIRDHYVYQLSYGQKQRVVLASALLCAPTNLIVLDEPFAHLDGEGIRVLSRTLGDLKENGSAIVLLGHDLERVAPLIDRWYLLKGGRLQSASLPFAQANPRPSSPPPSPEPGNLLLSARELTCRDSRNRSIFLPFNQDFCAGRVYGLTGPNGCGKSALAGALAGISEFTGGTIRSRTRTVAAPARRRKVKIVTQNPFRQMLYRTGDENLRFALRRRRKRGSAPLAEAGLHGDPGLLSRDVISLSRGEALRLSLLCALSEDPDLLILDEALVGLDAEGVSDFQNTIFNLRERGKCVLLISHLPELLEGVCDSRCPALEAG